MTAPTPVAVDPRPASRPAPSGGGAHYEALTPSELATGGLDWREVRDGYKRPVIRQAELLPIDVNGAAEQQQPA